MKLKCKNILLNSQILTGNEAVAVGVKIGIGDINSKRIYSIPPYPNAAVHKSLLRKSVNPTGYEASNLVKNLSESEIKDINADMKHFTLLDIINWLKFLHKADFEKYNQYILALWNINNLIINRFSNGIHEFNLCDKYSVLQKLLDKQSDLLSTNRNKTDFNQINRKINKLLKSKDKYFIDSHLISNSNLHICVKNIINSLREHILNAEIKQSKIKICPHCHHLTFNHFDFCQHCGKSLD